MRQAFNKKAAHEIRRAQCHRRRTLTALMITRTESPFLMPSDFSESMVMTELTSMGPFTPRSTWHMTAPFLIFFTDTAGSDGMIRAMHSIFPTAVGSGRCRGVDLS